jgi:hypothetical protein
MPFLQTTTTRELPAPPGGSARAGTHTRSAAASVLVHDLLSGPVRPASVIAAAPAASYLDVDGHVLAVVAPGGVRLPCAVVLASGAPSPAGPGTLVAVGGGAVEVGGWPAVSVTRWFDPRVRVRRIDPGAAHRLYALVLERPRPDPLLPAGAAARLGRDLAAGRPDRSVDALLGRGGGLTPAGDDLLAGALAALRALGAPAGDRLGRAVRELAPGRTARLSAALLAAADTGAVIPEAAAVLTALASPGEPQRLDVAVMGLVAVGHTSGWHLAAGLAIGAMHATRTGHATCDEHVAPTGHAAGGAP